ncbi:MAG: hypothetical protein KAH20_10390 [Methylococcales bacterium]|nr:hypothetical protein [Methylococcales bacterium]
MLLLLTLIGITGTQVTSLEEKMAGNAKDQNLAFQAAESALIEAEKFVLLPSTGLFTFYVGTAGLLGQDDPDTSAIEFPEPDFFNSNAWVDANTIATGSEFSANFSNHSGAVIASPRYIIKVLDSSGSKVVVRITARATGLNSGTQVILQEVFEKVY